MKISSGMCTWLLSGYTIMANDVHHARFDGVVLLWEESEICELEGAKVHRPNVMSFEVTKGSDRYYVVGCYTPPTAPQGPLSQTSSRQ